ncbi:unnamed protein product [Arabis nemorensis]|uniref:EF-hand domain-containing protein n=1 Tax=Arabis nemorensis TaxID=586526 RepID=A0A565AZL3_9BRAS|nr:unnamed protein product [Arabis nemorensis]
MAGSAAEGTQFDTRQFDQKMNEANQKVYDQIDVDLRTAFENNTKQGGILDFDGISGALKELKLTFQPLQIAQLFQNHKSQYFQQDEFMQLFSPMESYQLLSDVFSSCDPNKTGYRTALKGCAL